MPRPPVHRSLVWSLAFAGVLLGHAVTYVVLTPRTEERAGILASTGHGYSSVAVRVALAAAVIGLATGFLGRLGRRDVSPAPSPRDLIPSVVGFQALSFVAIELAERLVAAAPMHDLGHVLPVGVAVQFIVGVLVALALRIVLGAADACAETLGTVGRSSPRGIVPLLFAPETVMAAADAPVSGGRGPPR